MANRLKLGELLLQGSATRQGTHAVHALGSYRQTHALKESGIQNAWIAENWTLAFFLYPQMIGSRARSGVRRRCCCPPGLRCQSPDSCRPG